MKQFLAFKSGVAYGAPESGATQAQASANPGNLADGAMGVYIKRLDGRGMQLVIAVAAVLAGGLEADEAFLDQEEFYIARGVAEKGGCIITEPITRKTCKVRAANGEAAARVVRVLGHNGTAGTRLVGVPVKAFDQADVTIVEEKANVMTEKILTYSYIAKVDGEAPEIATANLVAQINADENSPATAATTGAGATTRITFTAKKDDVNFSVDGDGYFYGANTLATTALGISIGDTAKVEELEAICAAYQGSKSNQLLAWDKSMTEIKQTEAGVDYDIVNLEYVYTNVRVATPDVMAHRKKRVYLAIPEGDGTIAAALTGFLAAATDGTIPVESGTDLEDVNA